MNIFHKLDIHYPGTDIRAAAQGSWLGEGGCSLLLPPTLLRPKGTGLWREPSLTLTCGELVGGSQPHLSSAGELIPTDLEAAASPSSRPSCKPAGVYKEGGPQSCGRQRAQPEVQERGWDQRERASRLPPSTSSSGEGGKSLVPGCLAGEWKIPVQPRRDGQVRSNHLQTTPPPQPWAEAPLSWR